MKQAFEGWGGTRCSISALALFAAYDSGSPGWKKDGDSLVLDGSGNPIYIDASGAEMSVEHGTVARLNSEAKQHREAAKTAIDKLKNYEGPNGQLIDPTTAKAALDKMSQLDQSKLIDAGKLDEVKQQITQQYETRLSEVQKSLDTANDRYNRTMLDSAFKSSEFIKDNLAVPADLIQAAFRDRFKVDGDNIVPLDSNGNPLQSPKRIGETAGFEEALAHWIEQRPDRDVLLKAPEARGSGSNGGGGNRGQGRIIKRSDFDGMDPAMRADLAGKMGAGEVKIVD